MEDENKNYYTSIADVEYDDVITFNYNYNTNTSTYTTSTYNNDHSSWFYDVDSDISVTGQNNDLVIYDEDGNPIRVGESIKQIMDRLAIIDPDHDLMEKYPALKEAYNNYKLIEAMVKNDQENKE